MADLVTQLNDLMEAAVAAVSSGDFDTAINNAIAAQGIVAVLPRVERSSGKAAGSRSAAWTPEGIDQFIVRLRQQQSASIGVQTQNILYKQPCGMGPVGTWGY
jgi:hypothetical protein